MKLSGHRTEAIYPRYAIVDEGDLAEGVEKLAQFGKLISFQNSDEVGNKSGTKG